jgi:flagellar basal-body rod protein FlgB
VARAHGVRLVTGSIDSGLDFYRQVLDLRSYRQDILTADIANASTPGFKAVDLDFRAALEATAAPSAAASGPTWLVDDPAQFAAPAATGTAQAQAAVKYQTGSAVTLDGNSVDLGSEKVAAGENAVQYEAAASFASQIVKMLTVAINGAGQQSGTGG